MLIIPVSRAPDWRKPPLITLLLILVNVLVYFGIQTKDMDRLQEAYEYYETSCLPAVELPRYVKYLSQKGEREKADSAKKALERKRGWRVLRAMENDADFMKRLYANEIIKQDDEEFKTWREARDHFEKLRKATLLERYGFKPGAPTFSALIAHMFMHASFDHLLGNMAFLFIVGYMVEEALGKPRFLLFYLLAGMGAGGFDFLFNTGRMTPGIGASGAVSGVMAMFVVLYGMRKIRFFYWILVYFNFFKAPAILDGQRVVSVFLQ